MRKWVLASALSAGLAVGCIEQQLPGGLSPGGGDSRSGTAGPATGAGRGAAGTASGTSGTGAGGACAQPAEAAAFFEANVVGILDNGAGLYCASCHASSYQAPIPGPAFMGNGPDAYYDTIVIGAKYVNASPDNSLLLTKGAHTGPAFTPQQAETVRAWLTMEAEARFGTGCGTSTGSSGSGAGGGGSTGLTGQEALLQFAGCMTEQDWIDTGMPDVALQANSVK